MLMANQMAGKLFLFSFTFIPFSTSLVILIRSSLHFICSICKYLILLAAIPFIGIMISITANPARALAPASKQEHYFGKRVVEKFIKVIALFTNYFPQEIQSHKNHVWSGCCHVYVEIHVVKTLRIDRHQICYIPQ